MLKKRNKIRSEAKINAFRVNLSVFAGPQPEGGWPLDWLFGLPEMIGPSHERILSCLLERASEKGLVKKADGKAP